jgi:hypothetical protein
LKCRDRIEKDQTARDREPEEASGCVRSRNRKKLPPPIEIAGWDVAQGAVEAAVQGEEWDEEQAAVWVADWAAEAR